MDAMFCSLILQQTISVRVVQNWFGNEPIEETLKLPRQFELSFRALSAFGVCTLAKMGRNIFGSCGNSIEVETFLGGCANEPDDADWDVSGTSAGFGFSAC